MIILERIEPFAHENQFGFKKQHGTDTCMWRKKSSTYTND